MPSMRGGDRTVSAGVSELPGVSVGGCVMDFWYGVALTLLLETVALIIAAERIRRKMDSDGNGT